MVSITDIENFWTRGDLYSRINQAMSDSGLNNKKLEIEDLFQLTNIMRVELELPKILVKECQLQKIKKFWTLGAG